MSLHLRVIVLIAGVFFVAQPANAGFWDDVKKSTKKIVKAVPKVANPIQTQIDIVRGKKKPDQAIKDFIEGQGKAVTTITDGTRDLSGTLDRKFEDVATSIGGDAGKIIYEMSTGGQRIQREFLFTGGNAAGAVLQGQDPLIALTAPLAAAIRDAREKHINRAKPIPNDVKEVFSHVFAPSVLNRAKYVVGDLRISLPSAITGIQTFMGNDYGVVVDDVIVFSRQPDPNDRNDIRWWAHEMHHVAQYEAWGVDLFAYRYAKNHSGVEGEADRAASHVMSFVDQAYAGQTIQPSMSFAGMSSVREVTIQTPVGPATVYQPAAIGSLGTISNGIPLTNKCVVNGEYVVIDASNRVLSISRNGQNVGYQTQPLDNFNCVFDMVDASGARYCVHRPSGFVYAGNPQVLGQCIPCHNASCLQ
ncbi:hypothetical protein [uncultured Hoeflea sp.]|uniref:hypothetical protein n=1 Tax=uncultured Hoeflea sp. TaxID=538666 RepID=UPI002633E2A9|nr:hypothetical protein [uncultured Hoeflea sp.]